MPLTIQPDRLKYLLRRFADDQCSAEEIKEMLALLKQAEAEEVLENFVLQLRSEVKDESQEFPVDWEMMWDRMSTQRHKAAKIRSLWIRRIAVAAIFLLVVSGIYFAFLRPPGTKDPVTKESLADVKPPQTNRATVTLGDGRIVYLDSAANGQLAVQGNVKLVKMANGHIAYEANSKEIFTEIHYNTLTNPRGSKVIDMALSDGSHVWLNAGSSVTYPIAFTGKERKVSITGEAYFEVAHDAAKPFYVTKGAMEVMVLGTHFNINAYDDEQDIKVTLLEGRVKVSHRSSNDSRLMKPGQQVIVGTDASLMMNNAPDIEQVMAWKNGAFQFDDAGIESVIREITRWYDMEAVYQEKPTKKFRGTIDRNMSAANVFRILEETGGVHFRIEGKRIIVLK